MSTTKAYNELVTTILSEEDQQKFEWAIGAMLSGGTPNTVVIRGDTATGKTTLTTIVRKMLVSPSTGNYSRKVDFQYGNSRRVEFQYGDTSFENSPDTFIFVEMNDYSGVELDALVISTTGDRVPVNKHYVLTQQIDSELIYIAEHCIDVYRHFGDDYYSTFQENNR